jgi:hypothetical protein
LVTVLVTFRGWFDDAPPLSAGGELKAAPRSIVVLQRKS